VRTINTTTLALLTKIEQLVLASPRVPVLNKVMVDEEKLLDLLDNLRNLLPQEIEEARQIVAYKSDLMATAKKYAEQLINDSQKKAKTIITENEIVKNAKIEAENIRRHVIEELNRQQHDSDKYTEEVLTALETKLNRALLAIQNGRNQLARTMRSEQR